MKRRHTWWMIILLASLVTLISSCSNPQPLPTGPTPIPTLIPATLPPQPSATPRPAALGILFPSRQPSAASAAELYLQNCTSCHGEDGKGLVPDARNFSDADYLRGESPMRFYKIISDGRGSMPGWSDTLSVDERWDLAFYVWNFSVTPEMLAQGKAIFEQNCMTCHGPDGKGVVPGTPDFTDVEFVSAETAAAFFQVVTEGREAMPAWQGRLSPDERWDAIEYVRTFAYEPIVAAPTTAATPTATVAPTTSATVTAGDAGRGEALFNQDALGSDNAPGCHICHSLQPDQVLIGPSLAGMADDAAEDNPEDPAAFLREAIVDPNADIAGGFQPNVMYPNYGTSLTEQQINDLVAFLMTLTSGAVKETAPTSKLSGDPIRGGLLYDKWWKVTGADEPTEVQPLWVGEAESTGDTWRCQACHGWLYTGEGNYPGVLDLAGSDPGPILDALMGKTNSDHDFATVMKTQDLMDLALFISQEVYDTSEVVDAAGKPVNGDAAAGQVTFAVCAACHGPQGMAINFHHEEPEPPEYIPTIAQEDVGEFLSKAHWGQPGHPEMPAGARLGFQAQDFANLLAYLQQFPSSSPLTEGGQMYDKWWKAAVVRLPEGDMPLWAKQSSNTRSGADTWRCKECHGWDYKGVDGVYGSGSHKTGFNGIWDARNKSAGDILAALTGQVNPEHDFSSYLNAERLDALATFIRQGQIDKSEYITADKSVNGDATHGEQMYQAVCERCHGPKGTDINFGDEAGPEYVGTVASDNPWEFFNKASFGQPGEPMPAGLNMGWGWQDVADLAAYAQTLPISK